MNNQNTFIKVTDGLPNFECIVVARKYLSEFDSYYYELFIFEELSGELICSQYKVDGWQESEISDFDEYMIIEKF